MSDSDAGRVSGRAPRQARGRERRESIIDAAGEIVAALGPDALTIQAAARQAGASIGSMYHFFQNREELLDALSERHRLALGEVTEAATGGISPEQWRAMPAGEVIDHLFGAPLAYFARHRDALAILNMQGTVEAHDFQAMLRKVIVARLGEELGPKIAATLFSVCTGTLFFLRDAHPGSEDASRAEIPRVLTAYLAEVERAARLPGAAR